MEKVDSLTYDPLVLQLHQPAASCGFYCVATCCELDQIQHQRLVGVANPGVFNPDVKGMYTKCDPWLWRRDHNVFFQPNAGVSVCKKG